MGNINWCLNYENYKKMVETWPLTLLLLSVCVQMCVHQASAITKSDVFRGYVSARMAYPNTGCRTPICDMLSTLKWLNVRQRLILLKCVMMFKITNHMVPSYLHNVTTVISHSYHTRSIVQGKFFKSLNHPKSLKHTGVSLWNNLPSIVKTPKNIKCFKNYCTRYILGQSLH